MKNKLIVIGILTVFFSFFSIKASKTMHNAMAEYLVELEAVELNAKTLDAQIEQFIKGTNKKYHFYFLKSDRFLSFPEYDDLLVERYLKKGDIVMSTNDAFYYLITE